MKQNKLETTAYTGLMPTGFFALIVALLVTSPMPVSAQKGVIEEVVVTARKREESMQDVPISVQAFSGDHITEQGIIDIQQLAPYTPNFSYGTAAGASDLLIMRGLGTIGSGVHFEPSVGQQFNGYYSTRSRLGRSALMDLGQVEVLKGPQGVIIGRNNSLGALNITPNKPTDELEIKLTSQYNFDASEGYEVEAVVSGPLTENLRARAAVNYRDIDGWVKNISTGADNQKREDFSGRLIVDYDVTADLNAEFLYQRTDFDRNGKGRVINGCLNPAQASAPPIGFICTGLADKDNTVNVLGGVDQGEPFQIENDLFGLTLTLNVGDFEITSTSSYTDYEITDQFSGDQTPQERVFIANSEDYKQFMQEIRIASSFGDTLDYQFGGTYFTSDLDFTQVFHAVAGVAGSMINLSRNEASGAEQDSWSIFAAADWDFYQDLTLSVGVRWTDDDFDGRRSQVVGTYITAIPTPALCGTNGGLSACTAGNDGMQPGGTPQTGNIQDTDLSFNASLQYALTDNNMLYVSYAEGYKAGGFDLRGLSGPGTFIFPDEQSANIEIGGKHTFLDGTLRVNWSAFHTEVDDLQISTNEAALAQQIVGKAQVDSKGVELDVLWAATESLTLSFTGAYLDAEYDRFVAPCWQGQTAALGCTILNPGMAPGTPRAQVAGAAGIQDLSGEDTAYAPEWSFVLGADYVHPLQWGSGMELKTSAKWIFIDDQFMEEDHDPLAFQQATNRIDASIVLSGDLPLNGRNHRWTLGLIGKNLNDELVFQFSNPSSLSGANTSTTNIEETRSVSLQATFNW